MSREGALWIGGLEPYMDEDFLTQALHSMGEENVVSVKVIKNKFTGEPASYGFINFDSDPAALMAMHKLNGKIIPNSQPPVRFKLNHQSTRLMPGEKDHSIWVGDLTPDVDDLQLYRFFSARFQSVKSAKVVLDPYGTSKGYGFIRFGNEQEQQTSLISMMGVGGLGGKPIKVSIAVPKAKLEAERFGRPGGLSGDGASSYSHHSNSVADNLSPTALASLVSKVSGNPNAGAAVVAEAQSQEYAAYWQQYQQQYWSQWNQWNQYNQAMAASAQAAEQDGKNGDDGEIKPRRRGEPLFNGHEDDLVDHNYTIDLELENDAYRESSEELWEAIESTRFQLTHTNPQAAAGTSVATRGKVEREFSIWISDLTEDVSEDELRKAFVTRYESIKAVKIVEEAKGKLYGFVRFSDQNDQREALIHMNGFRGIGQKPIKVSIAVPKAGLKEANSLTEDYQDQAFSQYYEQYWSDQRAWGNYGAYQTKAAPMLVSSQAPVSNQEFELSDEEEEGDEERIVDYDMPVNIDAMNNEFMARSQEVWDKVERDRWIYDLDQEEGFVPNFNKMAKKKK